MSAPIIKPRPIVIDERDGPCEHCAAWAARPQQSCEGRLIRHCCRCGERIGNYQNMNGAGFRAPLPHHWHYEMIAVTHGDYPFNAKRPYFEELCLRCYWQSWEKAYPGVEFPAPPLELVQPATPPRGSLNLVEVLQADET